MIKTRKGINNPSYIDGRTLRKNYCVNCNKKISYKSIRCHSCANCITTTERHKKSLFPIPNKKLISKKTKEAMSRSKIRTKVLKHLNKINSDKNIILARKKTKLKNYLNKCKLHILSRTKLLYYFYRLKKYHEFRSEIFKRDNYTCQICHYKKEVSGHLNCHHKLPLFNIFSLYNIKKIYQLFTCKLIWDKNWSITVCEKCHGTL